MYICGMENAINLTVAQDEKVTRLAQQVFEATITEDLWQFNIKEIRLNLSNRKFMCIFEAHSEEGSFLGTMDLNDKKQGLKSSLKFELQND